MSFIDTPDFDPDARKRDGAIPRFYTEAKKNNFRSEAEGRPCFDEVEMVEILIPGDRRSSWVGLVKDEHKKRFPREYGAFKQGLEAPEQGTPIAQMPGITRAQAEELAYSHVKTVEALANLPDDLLSKAAGMGGYALREKAKRWVEATNGAAPMEKLAAENERQAATIAEMQAQMAEMKKAMDALKTKAAE